MTIITMIALAAKAAARNMVTRPTCRTTCGLSAYVIKRALNDYAGALAAVTNADDRTKFDAAVAQLGKSSATLASSVGMAGGPAISAAAGATVGASVAVVGWVVGTYLDHKRYEALSDAVSRSCLPVRTLVEAVGLYLQASVLARIGYDNQVTATLTAKSRHRLSRSEFEQVEQGMYDAVADLDALNGTNPRETANSIRKVHDGLAKAIADGKGQSIALLQEVAAFTAAASALKAAVMAQQAAK